MNDFNLSGELSEEERILKANANKFAREVMRPISQQLDEMNGAEIVAPESPYWDFMRQAYEIGYHKLAFPEAVGGEGLTPAQIQIVMEELAWGSVGLTLSLNTTFEAVVAMSTPQPEEYVKEFTIPFTMCKDGTVSGCWGITEPDHGCDSGAIFSPSFHDPKIVPSCTARLKGDEWVINGQKASWVSGATTAKTILLSAGVDPTTGFAGNGMFIFSLDRPGVSKGPPLEKMGMRDMTECEIFFDDVHVPKKALVVPPLAYEFALAAHLSMTLPMVGVWATGLARAAFEEALAYAKQRIQGGKLLIEHQDVQIKLFDMYRKVEASRQLCRAVFTHNWNMNNPPEKRSLAEAMAAKSYGCKVAMEVAHDAVSIFGGLGISKEVLVEKLYRDARTLSIADGPVDMLTIQGGYEITHPSIFSV